MINLQCVIFDMDGVIIESEPFHKKAYFETFNELGINMTDEIYSNFNGASTINTFEQLVEMFDLDEIPEELVLRKRKKYLELIKQDKDFTLIDGVLDIIKFFHEKGYKLVLASSSSMGNINMTFDRFNLHHYFTGKISGADLPKSKPHPDIFLKASEIADIPRKNCIVIEDSTNGIKAANSANIYAVGFKQKHSTQDLSKADLIINDFGQLKNEF